MHIQQTKPDLCIKQDSRDFSYFNIDELNVIVILLCTT